MTSKPDLQALKSRLIRFVRDEAGTTLVEFAVVLPLFLLIFFGLIEFGRLGFEYVMANKGVQLATRIAVARPAACPDVPATNVRGTLTVGQIPPTFGTNCRSAANVCASPATVTCAGTAGNATAAEIWTAVSPLMPQNATIANLRFTYTHTSELGFLGGPYLPMVTVEVQNLNFTFITPLGALATLAGSTGPGPAGTLSFPSLATTLPAEDLALGEAG